MVRAECLLPQSGILLLPGPGPPGGNTGGHSLPLCDHVCIPGLLRHHWQALD